MNMFNINIPLSSMKDIPVTLFQRLLGDITIFSVT